MYELTIDKALTLLINKKANVIENQEGKRYKLDDGILISVGKEFIPLVVDITDRWRVVK